MKIKTLIVDDEPHAIQIIERYAASLPEIEIIAKCNNAVQAFQVLQQKDIDLMFLDVKMPGLLGTDLVRSLKTPPKIIFTTAYRDYALEGFDLNAADYLLKPIPFERFLKAMDKIFASCRSHQPNLIKAAPQNLEISGENFLHLRVDRKMVKVNVKDIFWIESLRDYIKVVLPTGTIVSKQKIGVLQDLLPADRFLRIHRSFIVAIEKVESYYSYAVQIQGKELPIGRNYKADCRSRLR